MHLECVTSISWFVENHIIILKWCIKPRIGCLVSAFAKFLGFIYITTSLKCLIMSAKAHPGDPYHQWYKPQKQNYQKKKQRVNACLYLKYVIVIEYYYGQIKISTDFKARNHLSIYKKDISESYWVKKYRGIQFIAERLRKKKTQWNREKEFKNPKMYKNVKDIKAHNLQVRTIYVCNNFHIRIPIYRCPWFTTYLL